MDSGKPARKPFPKIIFVSGTDTGVGKTVVAAILTLALDAHYWKPIQSGGKSLLATKDYAGAGAQADKDACGVKAADAGASAIAGAGANANVNAEAEAGANANADEGTNSNADPLKAEDTGSLAETAALTAESGKQDLTDSAFLAASGVSESRILKERYLLSRPLSPHLAARLDGKEISLEDFTLPDCSKMRHLIIEGAGGLLVPLNDRSKMIDLIKHLGAPVLLVARSGLGTINHTLLSLEALRRRNLEIFGLVMVGEANPENRSAIEKYGELEVIAELPCLPNFQKETLTQSFINYFQGRRQQHAGKRDEDLASVHADAYCRQPT